MNTGIARWEYMKGIEHLSIRRGEGDEETGDEMTIGPLQEIRFFDWELKKIRRFQNPATIQINSPYVVRYMPKYNYAARTCLDCWTTTWYNTKWQVNGNRVIDPEGETRTVFSKRMFPGASTIEFILYLITTYRSWKEFEEKASEFERLFDIPFTPRMG